VKFKSLEEFGKELNKIIKIKQFNLLDLCGGTP
jgi:hypothetical protein